MPVILITGHGSIALAVDAMRLGADHFLTKPVDLRELDVLLSKAIQLGSLRRENRALRSRPRAIEPYIGRGKAMERISPLLAAAYRHRSPVLLRGETGTGKGLMARLIHERGPNPEEPFVELNCAALKGDLLESELFGHARGAFTGAVDAKEGLLERAHRGTLFLDEIGDMDPAVQAKFLKVLEEKRFRPLGRVEEKVSDFRLICATHQDLEQRIRDGLFRQDLFYRINMLSITLPPLRERLDELQPLAIHLLSFIAGGRTKPELGADAIETLSGYSWPGNLRELHNVLERAWILSDGKGLRLENLLNKAAQAPRTENEPQPEGPLDLESAEKAHILRVLRLSRGDVPKAAKLLRVSRATLYRKISHFQIELESTR